VTYLRNLTTHAQGKRLHSSRIAEAARDNIKRVDGKKKGPKKTKEKSVHLKVNVGTQTVVHVRPLGAFISTYAKRVPREKPKIRTCFETGR